MKHRYLIFLLLSIVLALPSCATENNYRPSNSSNWDNGIIYTHDNNHTYHAVGGWGKWNATDDNKMVPTSVDEVSILGLDLSNKPVEYIYKYNLTIGSADVDYTAKAKVDGQVKTLNGKYKIKVIIASWDSDEETYNHDHWITNPADTDPGNAEALTDNIFIPTYHKTADADGFSWADDPVITSGEGDYIFVCVKYTTQSTITEVGYGFALFKINY